MKLVIFLQDLLNRINERIRKFDFYFNGIHSSKETSSGESIRRFLCPWLCLEGHAPAAALAQYILVLFLAAGPILHRHFTAGLTIIVPVYILILLINRFWSSPANKVIYPLIIFLIGVGQLIFVCSENVEINQGLYHHILIPIAMILAVNILFAYFLAYLIFTKWIKFEPIISEEFQLSKLLHPPAAIPVSLRRFARSFFTVPFYHPLYLLLIPSLIALLTSNHYFMLINFIAALIVCWFLLTLAGIHEKLGIILTLYEKLFFIGGHLLVSITVILLALLRIKDVHYVSFLFEINPGRANWDIILFIFSAYTLFWFYEYWINRIVSERLLNILQKKESSADPGCISQHPTTDGIKGRLCIHGASRFIFIQGRDTSAADQNKYQTYKRLALFDKLLSHSSSTNNSIQDLTRDISAIKQWYRLYFTALNFILVVGTCCFFYYFYSHLPQKAELVVDTKQVTEGFPLKEKLSVLPNSKINNPVLFLAASGGGTRAALYTHSVLKGIGEIEQLENLVMASGVSGGGVALAYFSAHYDELLAECDKSKDTWKQFGDTMAKPFIMDVLRGASELRISIGKKVNGTRHGIRLGELLVESFEQKFFNGKGDDKKGNKNLSKVTQIGLILNTALTGHFPGLPTSVTREAVEVSSGNFPQHKEWITSKNHSSTPLSLQEHEQNKFRTSLSAGGRLIFTNLDDLGGFGTKAMQEAPSHYLPYIVIRGEDIPLSRAAALNANFPPVFSNAAVDVNNERRYWVTDGGAVENRGIISLLFALKQAVAQVSNTQNPASDEKATKLRKAHVLIADASAYNISFSQDRGLGSMTGASQKFGSELMLRLMEDLKKIYKNHNSKISFHYLAMPAVFLSQGGVVTHWMLPNNITFSRPTNQVNIDPECKEKTIDLTKDETRELIEALHRVSASKVKFSDNKKSVWKWVENDRFTNHQAAWKEVVRKLSEN